MKKLFTLLTFLCLLCSAAALAEDTAAPFTFRNGVSFGMSESEVLAAEGNVSAKQDRERVKGVQLDELKIKHAQDNGHEAKLEYYFLEGKLVAALIEYDDDHGPSYDEVKSALTETYGEASALDLNTLGKGIYLLDDDAKLGKHTDAFLKGTVLIVMHQDDDEVEVGYFDLTASYLK